MNLIDFYNYIKDFKKNTKGINNHRKYKAISFNPIVIYRGILWSNIVYLFKSFGFNFPGGSITRRHKMSPLEYRLAEFLPIYGLGKGIESA